MVTSKLQGGLIVALFCGVLATTRIDCSDKKIDLSNKIAEVNPPVSLNMYSYPDNLSLFEEAEDEWIPYSYMMAGSQIGYAYRHISEIK
jgi:hypothetical protein